MLKKLDDVIYNAASKPLIDLLQKWFHWSHFRLIATCLQGMIVFNIVLATVLAIVSVVLVFLLANLFVVSSLILLDLSLVVFAEMQRKRLKVVISALLDADRGPQNDYMVWAMPEILRRKTQANDSRTFHLVWAAGFIAYTVCLSALFISTLAVCVPFALYYIAQIFEGHLWRSSDVDPRDRRTIMESERGTSSAS